jgi:subtilisin family serine protease
MLTRWTLMALLVVTGARAAATDQQEISAPERYIIVAVDDSAVPAPPPAGGTPRGYDGGSDYGPSWHARSTLHALEVAFRLHAITAWPIHPLRLHCGVFRIAQGADRASVLAALSHDARVKLAQPLQTFATNTATYNDPYFGLQRGFVQMDVADAQSISQGDGVRVAIIDTGVDILHPDLRGRIANSANFVDDDPERFRRDRHGTEIAGVIAAVANNHEGIVGVAPRARLLVYKACWQLHADADPANCNSFTLAQALVAALEAHAQIINMSLAGPADPLLHDLIQEILRRGVLIVGAAATPSPQKPPGFLHDPGVIEVASLGDEAATADSIHAPGREILTLLPGGRYDFASGNSIATAQVTGVVALLLAKDSELKFAAVDELLRASSRQAGGGNALGDAVNACAAMASLLDRALCGARDRVAASSQ